MLSVQRPPNTRGLEVKGKVFSEGGRSTRGCGCWKEGMEGKVGTTAYTVNRASRLKIRVPMENKKESVGVRHDRKGSEQMRKGETR